MRIWSCAFFPRLKRLMSTSAQHTSNRFANLKRLFGMEVKVVDNGSRAEVTLPHMSHDIYDSRGNLCVWNVQKLLTVARFLAYHDTSGPTGKPFLDYAALTEDRYTFMASVETEIMPACYKRASLEGPFVISIHLGYVGQASLNSVAEFRDKTGEVLVNNTNQVVSVSKETRKATPLPDWWTQQYGNVVTGNRRLINPLLHKPNSAFNYAVKVPWSDVDGYKHTTFTAYIRYCMDVGCVAASSDFYSNFSGDLCAYQVKRMAMNFQKETNAGEVLNVATWENEDNLNLLHFQIENGEKSSFQNSIEFYHGDS